MRLAHSIASSNVFTCHIQNPQINSFVSVKGPSVTVSLPLDILTRAPLELGWRPSPASITPAFTNSSLYFPISASIFSLGISPASVLSFALIRTMTRNVISPYGLVSFGAGLPDGIDRLIPCSICTSNDVGGNRHVEHFFWVARLRARNAYLPQDLGADS